MLDQLRAMLPEGHDDLLAEVEAALGRLEAISAERDALAAQQATAAAERDALLAERDQAAAENADLLARAGQLTARYLAAVRAANPDLPEELVSGDSVEAIDAAVEAARAVVARVSERVRAEIAARAVPNGAPARTGPDLETLTPREKIALGLRRAN